MLKYIHKKIKGGGYEEHQNIFSGFFRSTVFFKLCFSHTIDADLDSLARHSGIQGFSLWA